MLGKKQREKNANFLEVYNNIEKYITREEVEAKLRSTVAEVREVTAGKNVGYGWSGGKDSTSLKVVMDKAGIKKCVCGMTYDLEYPEHLSWATENMPDGAFIFNSGLSLEWLAEHQDMLFPQDAKTAAKWFKLIQHKAQDAFVKKYDLDMVILGRRTADGNYIGKGKHIYTNKKGITRYSPIHDWTHEQTLGVIKYYDLPHSPIYTDYPNGYIVGTGAYPARQYTGSTHKGWEETYRCDPNIVKTAAKLIKSAQDYLDTL